MTTKNDQGDSTQPISSSPTSSDALLRFKQELYAGVTVKNRYVIEKELGRGGIGVVCLARDEQLLSKPVVIKILLEEMAASAHNPWLRKKFKQEIEALARIDHPGVVSVLDAGELDDGKPYLVMQYVEGVNLRSAIGPEGMPLERAAEIIRQTGHALSAAHDKGVYHRDLKPENIMLQRLGEGGEAVKLIDFGIAKVEDSQVASSEMTRIAGAMPYMAPEQLRGQPGAASDIFALGVIAYEMVTGRLPFYPGTAVELYEMHQTGVQVKPIDLRPDLPEAAQDVILKALLFDPAKRPPRARELGDALARALTSRQLSDQGAAQASTSSRPPPGDASPQFQTQTLNLEIAHVLFMDLVGYSKLPMDQQTQFLHQLQRIVSETTEFSRAQANEQLISLPTGDGMALVFFGDPVVPVQCALEIAHALASQPALKLRMGINTGPVYRIADINANKNVSGGGINMAQRVMDCGDAGHILLSNTSVDLLKQVGNWAQMLRDLGEQEVKHGARVHLYNLYTGELGNPNLPEKLRAALPQAEPINAAKPRSRVLISSLIALGVLLIAGIITLYVWVPPVPEKVMQTLQTAASRRLTYSITVQRYRDGKPFQAPFTIPGEMVVERGWRVRLNLTSQEDGYLYLVNEAPTLKNGLPDYNTLFPSPTTNNASAQLKAGQTLQIPEAGELLLDNQEGAEKVWIVWSLSSVAELDALKKWANDRDRGEVKDPAQARAVQEFLNKYYPASKPEAERDDLQTDLKGGRDGLLVHLVKLEHR
jgi:serine/threonine protein kinase